MHEFSDMDEVERVLETLSSREPALVAPAARGRWVHLWHEPTESPEPAAAVASPGLTQRVEALEREVAELKQQLTDLRRQFE